MLKLAAVPVVLVPILLSFVLQELGPKLPADVREMLSQPGIKAAFAIWTTTPWTIPANLAVAVNADLDYCLVKAEVCTAGAWLTQLSCCRLRQRWLIHCTLHKAVL